MTAGSDVLLSMFDDISSGLPVEIDQECIASCVRTACPKLSTSMEQLSNSCNKLDGIIILFARLFQQIRYSHDITL